MKNGPLVELIPRLARGAAPTAAIASVLVAPPALADKGDLDPSFGDIGRVGPIAGRDGVAWSLELLNDGSAVVSGGNLDVECDDYYYCYYYGNFDFHATNFIERVTADGELDSTFQAALVENTQVFDAVMQAGGKLVAVGQEVEVAGGRPHLVVFRLQPDGALDTSFGVDGKVVLAGAGFGNAHVAYAVALDSDGRIVVAGTQDEELLVLRLLEDGSLDASFGAAGKFYEPAGGYGSPWWIVHAASGGHRIMTGTASGCRVVALTEDGAVDTAFGAAGVATFDSAPGGSIGCGALAQDADGRLLVSGISADGGFVTRLLATGIIDPSFTADPAVASALFSVSAVHAAADGAVLLAGLGIEGAAVMRLQAAGLLDPLFGDGGVTLVDLPAERGSLPAFTNLDTRPDGAVVGTGGDTWTYPAQPFLIRLLGDAGGDSPGVIGMSRPIVEADEAEGEVAVRVRRTGGSDGQVSTSFETAAGDPSPSASSEDFGEVSGVLTWNDGEAGEREIVVPIAADSDPPEEYEEFRLLLSDTQGGAGSGTQAASVLILPDGAPGGQFAVDGAFDTSEPGTADIWVYRNFYYDGAVSVTVTPVAGSATAGDDFSDTPVTVTWDSQDGAPKLVQIPIADDSVEEPDEVFTLQLGDPTGGAIVGPHASATITIASNDQPAPPPPPPPPSRGGGGGTTGLLSVLMLGVIRLMRVVHGKPRRT
jgi:uncharacterized delta-60 repeat protein